MTTSTTAGVRELNGYSVPEAGTYEIDTSHTTIGFSARHLMISKVRGRFNKFSGEINIAEVPEDSSVSVEIDTASVSTDDNGRDDHLRNADFFDVAQHPKATFTSTSVKAVRQDRWEVTGDLSVRGVTKPVVLDVTFDGAERTPWGDQRLGFSASTEVDREDWGLTWNQALETGGMLVGKKIRIDLDVEAVAR